MGRSAWAGWVLVAGVVGGCGGAPASPVVGVASPSATSTPAPTVAPSPAPAPTVAPSPSASGPSLTADDLRSAPVPALCKHSGGRLKDGRLPGIPSHDGYVELRYRETGGSPAPVRVGSPTTASTS